ncbi:MAG: hypothetical protein MHM6MM_000266 [Cercozoa sp. M6MM]
MIVFVSPPKWRLPCSDADSLGALMVLKAANAQFEIRHVASENAKPFGEALPSVVVNGTRFCTLRGVLRFLKTTVSFKEEPDARGVLEDLRNLRRGTCDIVDVSDSKYAHDSEDAVSDLDKYVDSLLTRATQVIKRCGSVWRHFILAEILFLVARPVECKVTCVFLGCFVQQIPDCKLCLMAVLCLLRSETIPIPGLERCDRGRNFCGAVHGRQHPGRGYSAALSREAATARAASRHTTLDAPCSKVDRAVP